MSYVKIDDERMKETIEITISKEELLKTKTALENEISKFNANLQKIEDMLKVFD